MAMHTAGTDTFLMYFPTPAKANRSPTKQYQRHFLQGTSRLLTMSRCHNAGYNDGNIDPRGPLKHPTQPPLRGCLKRTADSLLVIYDQSARW